MIIKTPKGNKAKVFYSNTGIPTDGLFLLYQGYTRKNVIYIQPHRSKDIGLLQHELTHVDQYNDYLFFTFRYKHNKKFRFKMEIEAYTNQLIANGNLEKISNYGYELYKFYSTGYSEQECIDTLLQNYRRLICV